jgi:hypothetical protein
MPTVGDLDRLRRGGIGRGSVARPSVPADHFDLAVGPDPFGNGLALSVGQNVDHGTPLKINDNASLAVAAPPGEIVNADHTGISAGVGGLSPGSPANGTQQSVLRTRCRQSCHHARARPAAQGDADSMHNLIASRRSATVPPADLAADILAESRAATARGGAAKPAHGQQDRHCPTADRQIRQRSDITAVAGP